MKAAGGGKIINIGSMMSIFGAPFAPAYARLQGRHRAADEGAGHGLGQRQHPGQRRAARLDRHRADQEGPRAGRRACTQNVLKRTPAGRWGEPSDFAGIAVFLASQASDFVTGTAIPVDGGFSIQG